MRTLTIVVAFTSLALALPASAQQSESRAAAINVAVDSAGAASDAHPADQPGRAEVKGPRSLMGMVMAALIDSAEQQAQQRALPLRTRESARAAPPPAVGELLEEDTLEEPARVALQPTP